MTYPVSNPKGRLAVLFEASGLEWFVSVQRRGDGPAEAVVGCMEDYANYRDAPARLPVEELRAFSEALARAAEVLDR